MWVHVANSICARGEVKSPACVRHSVFWEQHSVIPRIPPSPQLLGVPALRHTDQQRRSILLCDGTLQQTQSLFCGRISTRDLGPSPRSVVTAVWISRVPMMTLRSLGVLPPGLRKASKRLSRQSHKEVLLCGAIWFVLWSPLAPSCEIFTGYSLCVFQVESLEMQCSKENLQVDVFPLCVLVMKAFRGSQPEKVQDNKNLFVQCFVAGAMAILHGNGELDECDQFTLSRMLSDLHFSQAFGEVMVVIQRENQLKSPLAYLEEFVKDLDADEVLREWNIKETSEPSEELGSRLLDFFFILRVRVGVRDALWTCFIFLVFVAMYDETLCRKDPCVLAGILADFAGRAILKDGSVIQTLFQESFAGIGSCGGPYASVLNRAFQTCQDPKTHPWLHEKFAGLWNPNVQAFKEAAKVRPLRTNALPQRKRQRIDESSPLTESEPQVRVHIGSQYVESKDIPGGYLTW